MKVGDMVVALYDEQRGLTAIGLVLSVEPAGFTYSDVKVLWATPSNPIGWWRDDQLRVISQAS